MARCWCIASKQIYIYYYTTLSLSLAQHIFCYFYCFMLRFPISLGWLIQCCTTFRFIFYFLSFATVNVEFDVVYERVCVCMVVFMFIRKYCLHVIKTKPTLVLGWRSIETMIVRFHIASLFLATICILSGLYLYGTHFPLFHFIYWTVFLSLSLSPSLSLSISFSFIFSLFIFWFFAILRAVLIAMAAVGLVFI